MHDPRDDHAFMAAALAAHTPARGRITVHPTPVASAPFSLAHDLLRSMGKHLPVTGSEDEAYWVGNTETAWRAVAAWMLALRVTRAHRISSRHFEYLFALRELTGIRLTLLCHGLLPPASPLRRLVAWWEADGQFPPREGEPCFLLPTRRTPGRGHIEAAARTWAVRCCLLPAASCPSPMS
ncbi:hypothetical protein [Streptomyces syringium]|uniref:hypothetical protein n=1 Tax=Streptomyces syringium TaxID=76729 RepID=UPI0034232A32